MSPAPSIIVNCPRTHSNLLQIVAEQDGLYLFFLKEDIAHKSQLELVGEGDFIDYETNPEARDIVHRSFDCDIWDADMLWSIATLNEDAAATELGLWAVDNDELWEEESVPVEITQQADVA